MINTAPSFFAIDEINRLSQYAGKTYRKSNKDDVRAGSEITEKLTVKTAYWGEQCLFGDFICDPSYHWQVMGQFAKYTWARIYRNGEKSKGVYFTVGVDFPPKALVYKLDCQHKVPNREAKDKVALTQEQLSDFYDLVGDTEAEWNQIDLDEIESLDWPKLIERTVNFIRRNEHLYDRAIQLLWHANKIGKIENTLELTEPPKVDAADGGSKGKSKSTGKPDYDKQRARQKITGAVGEEIVCKVEIRKLKRLGLFDLAKKVRHISKEDDHAGYDILSFNEKGHELYIEVKSTQGDAARPWYLTAGELECSKENPDRFVLYRVYDLDIRTRKGKYFRLSGKADGNSILHPTVYEARLKAD